MVENSNLTVTFEKKGIKLSEREIRQDELKRILSVWMVVEVESSPSIIVQVTNVVAQDLTRNHSQLYNIFTWNESFFKRVELYE